LLRKGSVSVKRINVINAPMTPTLLKLAWPSVISMLVQTIYNMIDAFWLGKLGKIAISAPTIAWNIIFLFISLGSGLSVAGLALVSQHSGAKNYEKASFVGGQVLSFTFILSLFVALFGAFGTSWMLDILNIPAEMVPQTEVYMKTILFGMPFTYLMFALNSLFSGWGDTFTPMVLSVISVSINAVLDPLMIFGIGFPRMEVFGAALATVISRGIIICIAFFFLLKGKTSFKIKMKYLVPDFKEIRKIVKIGLPSSLGQSITAFAFVIITSMIAGFGPVATSAFGVGNRIISFATMFSFGVAQATSTMVGQYLGADLKDNAYKVVWKSVALNMIVVGSICTLTFLFGEQLTAFFINDPEVLVEGKRYFTIVSFSIPFFASFSILDSALRGSGHTMKSMIMNIIRLWGIRLPVIYLLGESMGTVGLWYAMLISNLTVCIMAAIVIMRKTWLKSIIH